MWGEGEGEEDGRSGCRGRIGFSGVCWDEFLVSGGYVVGVVFYWVVFGDDIE